ncbi:MAG: hypothetical protein ACI8QC_000515 [Planctomycetota bacterium]|jgi:hypothetical protein
MLKSPLRWLLITLWFWCLAEVGAWVVLGQLTDTTPTYWGQLSRQRQLAAQDLRGRGLNWNKAQLKQERAEQSVEIRHPFLGSVGANGHARGQKCVTYWVNDELGDLSSICYSDEAFIVGIAGGSVAANVVRLHSDFIRERLAQAPQLQGKEIQLLCIANAGHKQPQGVIGLGLLQTLGVPLDAVLCLDGFNEIALYQGAAKSQHMLPAYPRQWVSRVGLSLGNQSGLARLDLTQIERAESAARMQVSSLRYSWIRQLLWHYADHTAAGAVAKVRGEVGILGATHVEGTGPQRHYADMDEQLDDHVAIWERANRRMDQLCRATGALYLNFLQPNQYDNGAKPLTDRELEDAYREDNPYRPLVEQGYPRLRERSQAMAADGVLMHDLSQIFEHDTETRYVDKCCHLNHSGSRILAEAMVEALLAAIP